MKITTTAHGILNLVGTACFDPTVSDLVEAMNRNHGTRGQTREGVAFILEQMRQHGLVTQRDCWFSITRKGQDALNALG